MIDLNAGPSLFASIPFSFDQNSYQEKITMGRLDADEIQKQSLIQGDKEQQIEELKELIRLLQFAADEVSDSQEEIRKSLERLHKFLENE